MSENITRPIIGIENRTAQEVFDIMVARIEATPAPSNNVVPAARAFMELFVVDNGEDRGLSLDHIDMMELTHLFAALDAAIKLEGSQNG